MKILVTAFYLDGTVEQGGSGRFMRCVIETLVSLGHRVFSTPYPPDEPIDRYDLIVCSHNAKLRDIQAYPEKKICIGHGVVDQELFMPGADYYVSISEEVWLNNFKLRGINSYIIGQPITIRERKSPNPELQNILIIRRQVGGGPDPFDFLKERYNVRISDQKIPIEEQIDWADLCITLGRGVLESFAQGKPVLVADNRHYMGPLGDGYVNSENIHEIARANFSGRRYRHPLTQEWVEAELAKYNANDSRILHEYVIGNHEAKMIVKKYLALL
jgi:hypothetical protein